MVIYLREYVFMQPHLLQILISFIRGGCLRCFVRPNLRTVQINIELAACKSTGGVKGEWDVITVLYV